MSEKGQSPQVEIDIERLLREEADRMVSLPVDGTVTGAVRP